MALLNPAVAEVIVGAPGVIGSETAWPELADAWLQPTRFSAATVQRYGTPPPTHAITTGELNA